MGIFVMLGGLFFLYSKFSFTPKMVFYPQSQHPKVQKAIQIFYQKDYLGLSSFVNEHTNHLQGDPLSILLFYQAESLFLQQKYQESWSLFFSLSRTAPALWQAQFRLGCIALLKKEFQEAGNFILTVSYPLEEVIFWKGRYYLESSEKEKALIFFKQVSYPEAFEFLAQIYQSMGKLDEALENYEILESRFSHYNPSKILTHIIALLETLEQPEKLLIYLEKAEKFFPYQTDLKIKKGKTLYLLKKIQESYDILSSPSLPKKDKEILTILAHSAFELRKYEESITYFDLLFNLSFDEKRKKVFAFMQTFHFDRAALLLKEMLENESIATKEEVIYLAQKLIQCQRELGELPEAIKTALILIALEESAKHYLLLAQIQKQAGKIQDSLFTLKKAAQIDPDMEKFVMETLIEHDDIDSAFVLVEKILHKNPYDENALFVKSKILLKQKNIEEAKITLYTLVYLPPKNQKIQELASFALASLLFNEKKYAEAEGFFNQVLKINPQKDEAAIQKAFILVFKKDFNQAKKAFTYLKNKGVQEKTLLAEIYYGLALIEYNFKEHKKARAYAAKTLEFSNQHKGAFKILNSLQ